MSHSFMCIHIKSPLPVDQTKQETSYNVGVSKNTRHCRRFYHEEEFD